MKGRIVTALFTALMYGAAHAQVSFDIIIRHADVIDGSGAPARRADIGIRGDRIMKIGDLSADKAKEEIDAAGLTVAPGFINMLSWADGTLLQDGTALSDLKQGVTLEVFGEGLSPGPRKRKPNDKLWTTLGGYFNHLASKGVSVNYASLVGATTVRTYVIGQDNRKPTPAEMKSMKELVRSAMEEGALGIGSSLIYAPANFASTEELIELCKEASAFDGIYMTHLRSESDAIIPALREAFRISHDASIRTSIYHLKINQQRNWSKVDTVLQLIDSARRAGLPISANLYPYTASATGLKERVPIWAQEGGQTAMRRRFRDPVTRRKILSDMEAGIPTKNSPPEQVVLLGFRKDSLARLYKGKRLDEVARLHGKSADETVLDLLVADASSIPALFFLMSEDNMRKFLVQKYVSIGSDAGALALTPMFLSQGAHPRAYGTFARILGKYSRDEKLLSLPEAVYKMTGLAAATLKLTDRGLLREGYMADLVLFDPAAIQDKATFDEPHQYAMGVRHVLVNGVFSLRDGEPTKMRPGRLVAGKGLKKK